MLSRTTRVLTGITGLLFLVLGALMFILSTSLFPRGKNGPQ